LPLRKRWHWRVESMRRCEIYTSRAAERLNVKKIKCASNTSFDPLFMAHTKRARYLVWFLGLRR